MENRDLSLADTINWYDSSVTSEAEPTFTVALVLVASVPSKLYPPCCWLAVDQDSPNNGILVNTRQIEVFVWLWRR